MRLRPHQERAIEMLRASIRAGNKRPLLAAPCSFGKTITAAAMLANAAQMGKRGIFICDRVKLVQQALESFDRHGMKVGVMQGEHERTNPHAPIQIASIQTITRRRQMPEFDFAIVDEAHTHYKGLSKMMDAYTAVPFIGLSATPYSKGLGRAYNDLVVPITPAELLDQGYLCPVDYYGGAHVDTSKIGLKRLGTGASDFNPDHLAAATEQDGKLTGDIIKNWCKHAMGKQTIAFSPSIRHSKHMVDMFNAAGIPAVHVDGYMDTEERDWIFKAHDEGEFLILSCSRLLNTGYDAPQVECLIDCFPTKSLITYVQRAGRIMRTAEGKERAIYLDHAGNVARFGFAENIVPDELHDGEKVYNERSLTKEKKEPKVKQCPQCYQQMVGIRCKCGYEIPIKEQLETTAEELVKLQKQDNKGYTYEQKCEWYGGFLGYAHSRGYKDGWAANKYREKFGVWPNKVNPKLGRISPEVMGFIKHSQIKHAKRRAAA